MKKDPIPQDGNMKRGVANKHKDRSLPQLVSRGGSFDRNVQWKGPNPARWQDGNMKRGVANKHKDRLPWLQRSKWPGSVHGRWPHAACGTTCHAGSKVRWWWTRATTTSPTWRTARRVSCCSYAASWMTQTQKDRFSRRVEGSIPALASG